MPNKVAASLGKRARGREPSLSGPSGGPEPDALFSSDEDPGRK